MNDIGIVFQHPFDTLGSLVLNLLLLEKDDPYRKNGNDNGKIEYDALLIGELDVHCGCLDSMFR